MLHSKRHGHSVKPKYVNSCPGRVNFTCCDHLPPCNKEYNQSYPLRSNSVYLTHLNRGLGQTKSAKGEYCNVAIIEHCIDHETFESIYPLVKEILSITYTSRNKTILLKILYH